MAKSCKRCIRRTFGNLIPASKTLIDQFARLDVHYFVLSSLWITNSVGKILPAMTGSTLEEKNNN